MAVWANCVSVFDAWNGSVADHGTADAFLGGDVHVTLLFDHLGLRVVGTPASCAGNQSGDALHVLAVHHALVWLLHPRLADPGLGASAQAQSTRFGQSLIPLLCSSDEIIV
jgi:hypothetical protein